MGFGGFLRGNTAATLKLGPFLDSTNGNDNESALTISQADVRLSKNGGDFAQKNDASAATHDELGYYDCPVNATDTNTYGRLKVVTHEAGALLVEQDYIVLPEIVYDSFIPSAAGAPLPLWGVIDWGTAQASAAGTLVHRSGLSLANDIPNGSIEYVWAGTGAGQMRIMHDFVGASDTANISPNWTTTPSTDSSYVTFGNPPAPTDSAALPTANLPDSGITSSKFASNAITAAALATDAVTEIQSGLATAADLATVDTVVDTILADTNDIQTRLPAALVGGRMDASIGATQANAITAAGLAADVTTELQSGLATAAALSTVASNITSILQDTGTDIPALIAALNDVSVTEILTTQMAESYAANGTAPTLAQALFAIHQRLMDFNISGTTRTVRRLDSVTTAFTSTLNDATNPTGETR